MKFDLNLSFSMISHAVIASQLSGIEVLTRFNYKKWKSDVELTLGLMDIDVAILEAKPTTK